MLNHDRMNNADPALVARASFDTLQILQHYHREVQAEALAASFLLLCERLKVPPQDVFVATKNMLIANPDNRIDHFGALRLYLQHEIAKQ